MPSVHVRVMPRSLSGRNSGINGRDIGKIRRGEFGVVAPHVNGEDPIADAKQNADKLKYTTNHTTIREMRYRKDKKSNARSNSCHQCCANVIVLRIHKIKHCRYNSEHGRSTPAVPTVELIKILAHDGLLVGYGRTPKI